MMSSRDYSPGEAGGSAQSDAPFTSDELRSFIAVVDFVPEGFAVYGPDNRLVVCNQAFREFAGELRHLFVPGTSFKAFMFAAAERGLLAEAKENEQAWVQNIAGELDGDRGYADLAYGGRWLRMRRHLLPDGYTVLHARDISGNVQAEQSLRQSESLLRVVTDNVPAPIVYMSNTGHFIFVNATCARWFRMTREGMIGRRAAELIGESEFQKLKPYQDAALGGAQVSFETTLDYPDGVRREVEITYAPHFNTAGSVDGFIALALDVSRSRASERQLAHSQRVDALGQLTGGIAHDFNNLLTVIIGNLRLAERLARDTDDQVLERVDSATRAAYRGAELVKGLLAFSRRQVLDPEAFAADALVAHLVDLLRRTLEESITLDSSVSGRVPMVNCDPAQLEAALLNLAVNARDAMPSGGRLGIDIYSVTMSSEPAAADRGVGAGDYVCLSVSDTGSGMPEEVSERAFEPFFTTKETGQGTGLGLSMVYGFIRQSGGFVELESDEGTGTTVRLYLPAVSTPSPWNPSGEADAAVPRGSETVLVVEDEAEVREVTVAQIEALGYRVLEACDGTQALALLDQDGAVDLLFTDMVMPGGMSGVELAKTARARWPELRVLYTSGYARDVIDEGHADPTSNQELLSKPYTDRDLARRLRAALDASG